MGYEQEAAAEIQDLYLGEATKWRRHAGGPVRVRRPDLAARGPADRLLTGFSCSLRPG